MITLADLQPNDIAVIKAFHENDLDAKAMRRFREMGLTTGTEIKLIRRAPLNDPIEISVRGALFSIRGENAKFIEVSQESGDAKEG
ncbi:MAG: ferrous iron transport protein A [Verrucomicrobiales bacterium]|nr:ferrous iron transport protein A [Verrucomicrobiales bacterium]